MALGSSPFAHGDDGAQRRRRALDDLTRIEHGRIALGHASLDRLDDDIQRLLGDAKGPIEALDLVRALDPPRFREMLGGGDDLESGKVSGEVLPRGTAEAALVETDRLPANAGQGEGRRESIGWARCGRRHDLRIRRTSALWRSGTHGQSAMADHMIDIDGLRDDSGHVDRRHHERGCLGVNTASVRDRGDLPGRN